MALRYLMSIESSSPRTLVANTNSTCREHELKGSGSNHYWILSELRHRVEAPIAGIPQAGDDEFAGVQFVVNHR